MTKKIDEKVNVKVLVRAEPERVYDAIATAKGLDGWFTQGALVDARAGGRIHFRWKNHGPDHYDGESEGPVLEVDRPNRFVFQWKVDTDSYMTTVAIDFRKVDEGTIVQLTEQAYDDTPTGLKDMLARATGWGEALIQMKYWVEHGVRY
ncbi:MAG TPA: SRPBCC domain-containing protein [Blastocatellia bacterium]|nr:SRPBCC domain-containing protein [Blastocatellia bacterium]